MEFGEMKRNTLNWSNFCILLRRSGLSASAGLSCLHFHRHNCEQWGSMSPWRLEVTWTR